MTIDFNAWQSADANAGPEDNPPADGTYGNVQVTAEFFTAKESGAPFVRTVYKDEAAQRRWTSLHGFGTPGAIGATKGAIAALGVNVDAIVSTEALEHALSQVALLATVRVKRSANPKGGDPFVNTYVQGGVRTAAPAPQVPVPPVAPYAPATAAPAAPPQFQAPALPLPPTATPAPAGQPVPTAIAGADDDIPF